MDAGWKEPLGARSGRCPEPGLDKRCELVDRWRDDDDVLFGEGRIVSEELEDDVTQDLDLTGLAVTGVDLDRAVGVVELEVARRGGVRAQAALGAL